MIVSSREENRAAQPRAAVPQVNSVSSSFGFAALAGGDDLRRIDGILVHLHLDHFAGLVDQIRYAPGGFVLGIEDAVGARGVAAPVAEQREGDADLLGN